MEHLRCHVKQLELFPEGDRRSWLGSEKKVMSNQFCISINMVALRWDVFELIDIKGRKKSGECTSEVEVKDAETLNYGICKYKEKISLT